MPGIVWNVYTRRTSNVGDRKCAPMDYFSFPFAVRRLCIKQVERVNFRGDIVVLGGGGILYPRPHLEHLYRSCEHVILWGSGYNTKDGSVREADHAYTHGAVLAGVRDYGVPDTDWVPCASCMDTAFDADYPVEHEVVLYRHGHRSLDAGDLPQMTNYNVRFREVVRFLGSGETVLTNSYHGVYWSVLLGRKVILLAPFSSKFHTMRHQVAVCQYPSEWRRFLDMARAYPEALAECREANRRHHERVCSAVAHLHASSEDEVPLAIDE